MEASTVFNNLLFTSVIYWCLKLEVLIILVDERTCETKAFYI